VASLWCLLTKGIGGKPTCSKPLVLCPSSLVQNWGKELTHWLGQRVQPVVVDDTKAPAVKAALQVRGPTTGRLAANGAGARGLCHPYCCSFKHDAGCSASKPPMSLFCAMCKQQA
jgi:hypothetical protein